MSETIVVETPALAHLYGAPVWEMPADLYIPPEALRVWLDSFEGPLDLLLYLIRKQNLDVLDIPMVRVTEQYLRYIDIFNADQFELIAEYLLMAAVLIDIKTRMLLPKPPSVVDEAVLDPRAELVQRLLAYEQMKQAGQALNALPQAGRDFAWVQVVWEKEHPELLPQVSVSDLEKAWFAIATRAVLSQEHSIPSEMLTVQSVMVALLAKIAEGGFVLFEDLLPKAASVPHWVVTLLAILELIKEQKMICTQSEPFAPIYVAAPDAC